MISSTTRPAVRTAATILAVTFLATPLAATTWYVPSQCPTIQAGIDSAGAGDIVLISCGTYYEHGLIMKSGVTLRAEGPSSCVIIDAGLQGRALTCTNLASPTAIEGITFSNGVSDQGGAIYCTDSAPTLAHCVFRQNRAATGGGVHCVASDPTFHDCVFEQNIASRDGGAAGGGLYCDGGSVALFDCIFDENMASSGWAWEIYNHGGGMCCTTTDVVLSGCVFSRNVASGIGPHTGGGSWGGGLSGGSYNLLTSCTFVDNYAMTAGAIICHNAVLEECSFLNNTVASSYYSCYPPYSSFWGSDVHLSHCLFFQNYGHLTVSGTSALLHCTIVNNTTYSGYPAVSCIGSLVADKTIVAFNQGTAVEGGNVTFSCGDVFRNSGGDWEGSIAGQGGVRGNFSDWPHFCDPVNHNFHLAADSPCLPGNHPYGYDCSGFIGALGQGCGPVALTPQTWARIKAKYK